MRYKLIASYQSPLSVLWELSVFFNIFSCNLYLCFLHALVWVHNLHLCYSLLSICLGKKIFHFVSTMCLHLVSKNFLIFVLVFAFVNNRVFLYDAEYVYCVSDFWEIPQCIPQVEKSDNVSHKSTSPPFPAKASPGLWIVTARPNFPSTEMPRTKKFKSCESLSLIQ